MPETNEITPNACVVPLYGVIDAFKVNPELPPNRQKRFLYECLSARIQHELGNSLVGIVGSVEKALNDNIPSNKQGYLSLKTAYEKIIHNLNNIRALKNHEELKKYLPEMREKIEDMHTAINLIMQEEKNMDNP